jgi:hypothetical protein
MIYGCRPRQNSGSGSPYRSLRRPRLSSRFFDA